MQAESSKLEFEEPTRHVANAFSGGIAQIPNNPLIAAVFAAIFKGGPKARSLINGWRIDQDGIIKYRHIGRRGGEIVIYFDIGAKEALNLSASVAQQIALIEHLKPLTADALLAALAQICERGTGARSFFPSLTPVSLSLNAVLQYKGVKRWGFERSELRKRIKCELELLSRLRFNVLEFPGWDPAIKAWNHKGVSVVGDRVFNVVSVGNEGGGQNGRDECTNATWKINVGHWGRWWLNAQAKVWLGEIPQDLIEFDHRTNRGAAVMAKKIGISVTVLLDALKSRSYVERRVDHLLEATGELPIMEARNSHWAGRTRDRFDEALLRLQESGVFRRITWLSPEDMTEFDHYEELDRNKGWVERWLGFKVRFYRRQMPHMSYSGDSVKSVKRKGHRKNRGSCSISGEKAFATGSHVRRQRIACGMSQLELAKMLEVSNGHLSKIESEKVPMTNGIRERLSILFNAQNPSSIL